MTPAPSSSGPHRVDRDDLLARINLADVLDAVTTSDGVGTRRAWHCPEPSHPDRHPSVTINVDRHGVQRWRCWSGGHGGTAIDAVIAARNLPVGDAMRWLAEHHTHLEPVPHPPPPTARPVGEPAAEVIDYVGRCEKLLWSASGARIRDWLHERGLSDEVLHVNRVGADPGRRFLPRPKGFPAGWPAAVYPALDPDGSILYFQARLIDPPAGRDKYDNPARHWASNPRLGWVHPARRSPANGVLVVTEGIADALVAADSGLRAVGILGSTYPDRRIAEHINEVVTGQNRFDRVVVCFDADTAGRSGARRLVEALTIHTSLDVALVEPPNGMDLTQWAASSPDWRTFVAPPDPTATPNRQANPTTSPIRRVGLRLDR